MKQKILYTGSKDNVYFILKKHFNDIDALFDEPHHNIFSGYCPKTIDLQRLTELTSINQYDAIVIEDYGTKAYFQGPGPGISYAPVIGDLETPKVVVWSLLNDFLEKRINPYEEQFKNIHSATNDTVIGVLEDIFEK